MQVAPPPPPPLGAPARGPAAPATPPAWPAPILVGHSGAGFVLPFVAERLGARVAGVVFVDAGLPPCEGEAAPGAGVIDQLRALAVDGMLPRWSTWWDEGTMEALVPS